MDRNKITQRLAHFLVIFANGHKPVVHPITHKLLAGFGLTLGNFVFMVRKFKILDRRREYQMYPQGVGYS